MEVSEAFLERIKDYRLPDELDKVTREFFLYSFEQDAAYEKITCSGSYYQIRNIMLARVNDVGWSKSEKFANLNEFEKKVLLEFVNNSALSVYKRWIESGKTIPLEEVIQMANQLCVRLIRWLMR